MYVAGLVAAGNVGKVPPLLPAIRGELGLTLVESGFVAIMLNLMGSVVGMFAGLFADRYGHKRFALAGLALLTLGSLAGALAGSYAVLLVSRFLEGAGFIMTSIAGVALITNVTLAADRPRAMSMWSSYLPTGVTVAMLAAPFAFAAIGWRGYWIVTAIACAAALVLVARLVPVPSFGGNLRIGRLAAESLRHKGAVALSLAFIGYTAEWATIMVWLPTYAVEERGATPAAAALLTVAVVAINVPGNFVGGWLMSRGFSRASLIVIASAAQALSFVGIFIEALPDALRYACCLSFSLVGGLIPMAVVSGVAVHARTREHIGTTNGMVMQAAQVGQVIGPLLVAAIASRLGWQASLPAMLGFAAISAAAGIALGRIERTTRPAP